jgi:hypothetical protein
LGILAPFSGPDCGASYGQVPGGFTDKFMKKMVKKQTDDFVILAGFFSVFI